MRDGIGLFDHKREELCVGDAVYLVKHQQTGIVSFNPSEAVFYVRNEMGPITDLKPDDPESKYIELISRNEGDSS
ncbi:hypothetical protein Bsel_0732 [[Bacillus] selenitireducens MLS10]|uniref:Uncharacterized protein n=1 Tax=Bacillus selenitireducens (strain ATCC 700615 / DSM 15326 / MLS10) TaxID=439292 RepID=D6XYV4_BACIE|nr:hypothetical protein Bsel_0732 [[Bacillus] selenitireducens MLS10]